VPLLRNWPCARKPGSQRCDAGHLLGQGKDSPWTTARVMISRSDLDGLQCPLRACRRVLMSKSDRSCRPGRGGLQCPLREVRKRSGRPDQYVLLRSPRKLRGNSMPGRKDRLEKRRRLSMIRRLWRSASRPRPRGWRRARGQEGERDGGEERCCAYRLPGDRSSPAAMATGAILRK
jgi:hypothetical protein